MNFQFTSCVWPIGTVNTLPRQPGGHPELPRRLGRTQAIGAVVQWHEVMQCELQAEADPDVLRIIEEAFC